MKLLHLAGAGILSVVVGAVPALASDGRGMTWVKIRHENAYGVDFVGCTVGSYSCNGYVGDTSCKTALPVLCIKNDGSPTPKGLYTDFYSGWARGHIATTQPIPGTQLTSQAAADKVCVNYFGAGWRMAEHHDGNGGWGFHAYGNIRNDTKFWVRISDQPGNCWNP